MARIVLTNAEMQALINAGQDVIYKGRVIKEIADLPNDAQILIDYPEYAYNRAEGNAKGILGYSIFGTPSDGDTLIWSNTNKRWEFGAGGGGGGSLTVKEVDGSPSVTATTLEFDQADGFLLSSPSAGIGRVKLSNIGWSLVNKTGSSLADLTTRSASDLTSGILAASRGGAGNVSGILRADGLGNVSATTSLTYGETLSTTKIALESGKDGLLILGIGQTAPPISPDYGAMPLTLKPSNGYSLRYVSSDANNYEWAVGHSDNYLFFGYNDATATYNGGYFYLYPNGMEFFSQSPTHYGYFREVSNDVFGLGYSDTDTYTGTNDMLIWRASGLAFKTLSSAIADGDLPSGFANPYLDETNDLLKIKWKESGGTILNRTVAFTDFSQTWAASQTLRLNALGTTSTDGLVLENTTAAAVGAQQYSPRLRLTGRGWRTNATAESQAVSWIVETRPVQGSANPTGILTFGQDVNSGGYFTAMGLDRTASNTITLYLAENFTTTSTRMVSDVNGLTWYVGNTVVFRTRQASSLNMNRPLTFATGTEDAVALRNTVSGSPTLWLGAVTAGTTAGNLVLGVTTNDVGTGGRGVLVLGNGTVPASSPIDEIQFYSADIVAGRAAAYVRPESGRVLRLSDNAFRVSSQFDKTNDTLADLTLDDTPQVEAGKAYNFVATLYTTSNSAAGVKFAIAGTATATSVIYEAEVKDGSTIATVGTARATALGTTVGDVTNVTAARVIITGTILVSSAGTLRVQFAQNSTNATASNVLINSTFILTPIS